MTRPIYINLSAMAWDKILEQINTFADALEVALAKFTDEMTGWPEEHKEKAKEFAESFEELLFDDHNCKIGSQEADQTRSANVTQYAPKYFDTENAVLFPETIHGETSIVIMEDATAMYFKYGKGRGVNDSRCNRPGPSKQDTSAGKRAKFQLYAVPVKKLYSHLTYKQFTVVHVSDHKQKMLNRNAGFRPKRKVRNDKVKTGKKHKPHKKRKPCEDCGMKYTVNSTNPTSRCYCPVYASTKK